MTTTTERYSARYSVRTSVPHIARYSARWCHAEKREETPREETPRHREVKNFMAGPISNRPLAQCARRDDLDLTLEQGEAR